MQKLGKKEVGKLSVREQFLIGIALYFAEGSKTGNSVEFTNSDPTAVVFMVNWLKQFCHLNDSEIKCSLWLHDNLSDIKAKKYWSKLTNIPLTQFGKTYIAKNKVNSPKIRKNLHQYGIIKLRVYNAKKLRLIKGWIEGIFSNLS